MVSGSRIAGLLAAAVAVVLAVVVAVPATAAPSESRDQYVSTLEPICKRDSQRTLKVLRGTEKMIRNHKLKAPARKFARAARISQSTLKRIRAIEPAAGDEAIVKRWLGELKVQVRLLNQMSKVLARGQRGKVLGIQKKILRSSNRANSTVFLFGFKHCQVRPDLYG